jgi:Tfp pilus assembly protein PilX
MVNPRHNTQRGAVLIFGLILLLGLGILTLAMTDTVILGKRIAYNSTD